jgi:hypothetical protein
MSVLVLELRSQTAQQLIEAAWARAWMRTAERKPSRVTNPCRNRYFTAAVRLIEIMECDHLKYLCKEHLGLDVLISLPKPPPERR